MISLAKKISYCLLANHNPELQCIICTGVTLELSGILRGCTSFDQHQESRRLRRFNLLSIHRVLFRTLSQSDLSDLTLSMRRAVADLGEGPRRPRSPFPHIFGKKKDMTEGRKASWASKSNLSPPPPPAKGLDLPLQSEGKSVNQPFQRSQFLVLSKRTMASADENDLNCTALSQSESSYFFMYIINKDTPQ